MGYENFDPNDFKVMDTSDPSKREKDDLYHMTVQEIGAELGISHQRVSQILNKAIAKVRRNLGWKGYG